MGAYVVGANILGTKFMGAKFMGASSGAPWTSNARLGRVPSRIAAYVFAGNDVPGPRRRSTGVKGCPRSENVPTRSSAPSTTNPASAII